MAVDRKVLEGKRVFLIFQGASPADWMIEGAEYTIKRYAALYGMTYEGMANDMRGARKMADRV